LIVGAGFKPAPTSFGRSEMGAHVYNGDVQQFKDHFSAHADEYARRRPHYPPELFEYLGSVVAGHELAWDCGTGNGQAAVGLAPYFERVIATDPSADQLRNAFAHPKVEYRQARAEDSGLDSASFDLVTVAQALHWFDMDLFYAEARRTLKPEGLLAVWAYALCKCKPEVDRIIDNFYYETVGPYWPRERKYVDEGYRTLSFPFDEIEPRRVEIALDWDLDDMLGYLRTWSPTRRYIERHGTDPVSLIERELAEAWGEPGERRRVVWPINMRIGHNR
jgi:SAM-dependent methyltransferase